MKHKFVFATNNAHKLEEVTAILGKRIELLSLKDIHCHTDIPETADTLEGNALLKAQYIYENYQMDCFADDTGLEVEALNGEPGVYSARYAGEEHDDEKNNIKLLKNLSGISDRRAKFVSVVAFYDGKREITASGAVEGEILHEKSGNNGFGYDPLFYSTELKKSFGEASAEEKNAVSHRARAFKNLTEKL